ncbi:type II secretion system F family protein [Actinoallomurus iriomotensis]|uniref:Type II secretion system protein n=1 Tax=Actinoallomurus iriomotensis TaxID=478107 RepID=A0A9W6S8Y5_9ACTN|nr:type II secretion system F family protein [Actinoallomurus iriomotensis]GLY76809.1 type II secretion system protein [Actinoallomurus iriomotensis]GLY89248.1 type II secretion system protein [Actinoallomurus iriomotensis]
MTVALLAGAFFGLGAYLLFRALFPPRPGLSARLAAFDAARRRGEAEPTGRAAATAERVTGLRARFGRSLAAFYESRGWQQRSVRADLTLLDRSFENFLATKFLLAIGAIVFIPILVAYFAVLGLHVVVAVPVWLGLFFALIFFLLPDMQLRQEAASRRRDFRHAVSAFLDLVAMNLAGGRGVPEALMTAANVGDGWAVRRIRDALANARITGITPWQALGRLGDDVNVDELRDLSAALALVADDGAKVRQSLSARAASMRSRQLADIEGKAGERSQSMLVAQLLLCAGFLVFLAYPAVMRVVAS